MAENIKLQNKDYNIEENSSITPIVPDDGYDGISGGTINVNIWDKKTIYNLGDDGVSLFGYTGTTIPDNYIFPKEPVNNTQGMKFAYSKIEKLNINNYLLNTFNNFLGCNILKDITVNGIWYFSETFEDCALLTKDSLLSILNALADRTGETEQYEIVFHPDSFAQLTEEEIAIGTNKNWIIKSA